MLLCWIFLIVFEMGKNQVIQNVKFDITCDDYCVSIDSGNENIHRRNEDDTITCNWFIRMMWILEIKSKLIFIIRLPIWECQEELIIIILR